VRRLTSKTGDYLHYTEKKIILELKFQVFFRIYSEYYCSIKIIFGLNDKDST